jgi:hypothetical protein
MEVHELPGNLPGPTDSAPPAGCPVCGSHRIFDVNLEPLEPAEKRAMARAALEDAAAKLARSETGQEAARLLHRFLRGAGGNLDATNQLAVMTLLGGAFSQFGGTVPELLAMAATGPRIVNTSVEDAEL